MAFRCPPARLTVQISEDLRVTGARLNSKFKQELLRLITDDGVLLITLYRG
jgi:hypothetical protein